MLVEIRIGPGKQKLSSFIFKVKHRCGLSSYKIHRVPHITLYGSFKANPREIKEISRCIITVCEKYSFLPYLIDGFKSVTGKKGKVIFFNIIPSEELKKFRKELSERLIKIAPQTKSYDKRDDFLFHATLAYKLNDKEFERTWTYLFGKKSLIDKLISILKKNKEEYVTNYFYLPMNALRVTFLSDNSRIICEFDFLQKRLLSRREALSRREWQKTLRLFRIKKGIEGCYEKVHKKSVYLIGDLHLDHANIIKYCARPFSVSNVQEMNRVLIDNWNNTIKDDDVYFLGDLSFGKYSRPSYSWFKYLKGKIHFIRGNHEENVRNSKEYEILEYDARHKFLLVHDPDELPIKWKGWVVHGHKHNNDIKNYPFINGDKKTINVSAELINYKPISLDFLMSLKLDSIKRMDTIDSELIRK